MLHTPTEILERNPEIKKRWTAQQLGWLLPLGLVRGRKISRGSILEERDVLIIFEFCKEKKNIKSKGI